MMYWQINNITSAKRTILASGVYFAHDMFYKEPADVLSAGVQWWPNKYFIWLSEFINIQRSHTYNPKSMSMGISQGVHSTIHPQRLDEKNTFQWQAL